MAYSRVTDVLDFSNVPFADRVIMYAKPKRMVNVLSIKRTETSVEHADWKNASKLEWTKMPSNMNEDLEIQRFAVKWQCLWAKI